LRWALAFEVVFLKAFAASAACVGALANGAVIAFIFGVTFASVTDAHAVAGAGVRARRELAGSAGPHVLAQADTILADTVAVTVIWASLLAAIFAGPSFLTRAFKRF